MQRIHLFSLAATFAGALAAQSNTVAGLDGRISAIDSLTYWGRRGPANPGGEVGMSMLNTMCNPGTVNIPWQAAMSENHPKFGFLITRESGGRMVQISDRSFCKHAFTSTNSNGACGTCISPGTGSLMGVHCSDTYGAGNNGDRDWLGPADEIDPWLGTWNHIHSYFDRGDPEVAPPANTDGVRSLVTSGFDVVKNRVTVKESDLLVAGARYFYGIKLIHQGEAGANRGDNIASRGFSPVWNGSSWSFGNNGVAQVYGSILQHWTGATLGSAGNGTDDGTFYVAVTVTPLGGGIYHYEYAVQNVDNNRGGASFRVPLDVGATLSNVGFRDIDSDPLNDWTNARVGSELVFSATATNPHNWNTIYNFWFDCSVAPSNGTVRIDEARVGPGLLTVSVPSRVPSGIPTGSVSSVGIGCGGCTSSFYENFGSFDLGGNSMTMTLTGGAYTVGSGTGSYVAPTGSTLALTDDSEVTISLPFSFPYPGGSTTSLAVCSNGFISRASNGTAYTPDPSAFLAFTNACWSACWHDFNPGVGGAVRLDSSAAVVRVTWLAVPNYSGGGTCTFQYQFLPNGTVHILWPTMTVAGNGALVGYKPGGSVLDPGNRDLSATLPATFSICGVDRPALAMTASAPPVLGTSVNLTTSNVPSGSPFGATVLSFTQAIPPTNLTAIGMPGCEGYLVGGSTILVIAPGATFVLALGIPSQTSYIGMNVIAQGFTYSPPLTPLGAISSNGLVMILGL